MGSWDLKLQKLLGLSLMVKDGFLRPSYTISEEAKDADAKLVNQKKEAQGRDKELGRKEGECRKLKYRKGRGGEIKPNLRSSQKKIIQKGVENVC